MKYLITGGTGFIGSYYIKNLHGDNNEIRGVFAPWIEAQENWDGVTEPVRYRKQSA